MNNIFKYISCLVTGFLLLASCTDKWEEHFGDANVQETLFDVISSKPEFSVFLELLNKSGYAESLKASKNLNR